MTTDHHRVAQPAALITVVALIGAVAAGCGGTSSSPPAGSLPSGATSSTSTPPAVGTSKVLPVASNPIANSATAPGLEITKALVENNVSSETGKAVADHLEVGVKNATSAPIDSVEIYYAINDPSSKATEGYYTKLAGFTIAPGATRVVHFDDTGAPDHYPVNKYSLYYTDKNALVVDITASAPNLKPATFSVKKDAGGAEAGIE